MRTCPKCAQSRPLHQFRRWRGAFRVLHSTCNICDPERDALDIADPAEREAVMRIRNMTLAQEAKARARQEQAARERSGKRAAQMIQHKRRERRAAWVSGILGPVREELRFAKDRLSTYRYQDEVYRDGGEKRGQVTPNAVRRGTHHYNKAVLRFDFYNAHRWLPFYEAYVQELEKVKTHLTAKVTTVGEKLKPTEEETKLSYYLDEQTIFHLRRLYSDGIPPRGVRHREPWVINADASRKPKEVSYE